MIPFEEKNLNIAEMPIVNAVFIVYLQGYTVSGVIECKILVVINLIDSDSPKPDKIFPTNRTSHAYYVYDKLTVQYLLKFSTKCMHVQELTAKNYIL